MLGFSAPGFHNLDLGATERQVQILCQILAQEHGVSIHMHGLRQKLFELMPVSLLFRHTSERACRSVNLIVKFKA